MMDYPRWDLLSSCQDGRNFALNFTRQTKSAKWRNAVVSQFPAPAVFVEIKDGSNFAPLWYYDEIGKSWRLNFDPKLYAAICEAAGIDPEDTDMARADGPTPNPSRKREGSETSSRSGVSRSGVGNGASASFRAATGDARPSEVKVFDYIYGVLHSPDYRETFAEFLKIDFPRIPYPASPEVFNHVSEKGEQLRRLHLMEPAAIGETLYPFVGEHEDEDERDVVAAAHPKFVPTPVIATPDLSRGKQSSPGASGSPRRFAPRDDEIAIGRVYINPRQYFDKVPQVAWEFYIGGYQPAQKWLKDRKGRVLSWDDITHYQSIVKILLETDRIMREIKLPIETA